MRCLSATSSQNSQVRWSINADCFGAIPTWHYINWCACTLPFFITWDQGSFITLFMSWIIYINKQKCLPVRPSFSPPLSRSPASTSKPFHSHQWCGMTLVQGHKDQDHNKLKPTCARKIKHKNNIVFLKWRVKIKNVFIHGLPTHTFVRFISSFIHSITHSCNHRQK